MTELLEEVHRELLECARYGEHEDMLTLINEYKADVNHQDDRGNTALHKAAANDHVKCLEILQQHGAKFLLNHEGNSAVHWAAQNGKAEALKFLFQHFTVDVLSQNISGRSALTEAFQSGNTDAIEACLSHESATEERLIPGTTSEDTPSANIESKEETEEREEEGEGEKAEEGKQRPEITHEMQFSSDGEIVRIRELPITRADNPFGSDERPEDDTTGLGIWPASILLSRWIAGLGEKHFQHKTVLELGAGCGLPAITSAIYCSPKRVYISDIHDPTLANAKHNIVINARQNTNQAEDTSDFIRLNPRSGEEVVLSLRKINWKEKETFPAEPADVLLGSDLVYDVNILSILIPAIPLLLKSSGEFLYVAPNTGRDGMDELISRLDKEVNMVCAESFPVPDEMYGNPLVNDEEDHFILYFYDLSIKQPHTFYRFVFKS